MLRLFLTVCVVFIFPMFGIASADLKKSWAAVYEKKAVHYYDSGLTDSAAYCYRIVANMSDNDYIQKLCWLKIALIERENDDIFMAKAALIRSTYIELHENKGFYDKIYKTTFGIINEEFKALPVNSLVEIFSENHTEEVERELLWQVRYILLRYIIFNGRPDITWSRNQIKQLKKGIPIQSYRDAKLLELEAMLFSNEFDYEASLKALVNAFNLMDKLKVLDKRPQLNNYLIMIKYFPVKMDGEYHQLLEKLEQKAKNFNDSSFLALIYLKMAQYFNLGVTDELSMVYAKQALKLTQWQKPEYIHFLAYQYEYRKEYKKALECFMQLSKFETYRFRGMAMAGLNAYRIKDYKLFNYYKREIRLSLNVRRPEKNEYALIEKYYVETNQVIPKLYKQQYLDYLKKCCPKSKELCREYVSMGNSLWFGRNDYQKALENYHQAIISILPQETNQDLYAELDYNSCISIENLITALNNKGEAFYQLSKLRKNKEEEIRDLKACYKNLSVSINQMFQYKLQQTTEEQKYFYSNLTAHKYPNVIKVCLELFFKTGEVYYRDQAFQFAEQSKASVLLGMLRTAEGSKVGLIPEKYKVIEDSLNFEINRINHWKLQQNDSITMRLSSRQAHLVRKRGEIELIYKEQFPAYYNLKYSSHVIELPQIQKSLSKEECIVEYMLSRNFLISFYIDKDKVIIKTDTLKSINLATLANNLYKQVFHFQNENYKPDSIDKFARNASTLYDILLKPFEKEIGKKHIIIIPDDALNKIPFEVLLKDYPHKISNYKDLPYLIRTNTVYYAPSVTFLSELRIKPLNAKRSRLLAVAPIHSSMEIKDTISREYLAVRSDTSLMSYLPNARKEISYAHSIAGGKMLIDKKASESRFKKIAGNYDILHIATHGILDTLSSLRSKLILANSGSETSDGFLHTYEIYNLRQSSQLVILSACNTGSGDNYSGEGVINLARGFLSSGSRSVIMTLWSVNDNSSYELIKGFYDGLKKRKSIGDALSISKLKYLDAADNLHSHPYFWTGYVIYGDASRDLKISNSSPMYLILLFFVVLTTLVVWKLKVVASVIRRLFYSNRNGIE